MDEQYNAFLVALETKFATFKEEAIKGLSTKAASLRARKLSMELRTDLTGFRVLSLENDKKSAE